MHDGSKVVQVLDLHDAGLNQSQIARETGLARSTVKDWLAGRLPHSVKPDRSRCGHGGDCLRDRLWFKRAYAYVLGMYLGDGCISELHRGVYSLRISLDRKYPEIVFECECHVRMICPDNRVSVVPMSYRDSI